jgi:hypothetical protein
MILIGPESVVIGSDRPVPVEKAKRERAKVQSRAITGPRRRPVGLEMPLQKRPSNSRFVPPYDVA